MEQVIELNADTDWNRVWASQTEMWRQSAGKSCREFWADESSARVYAEKSNTSHEKRILKTVAGLNLSPHDRVLDIGAGPGNLALPMAEICRSVTTVEPSPGMNRVMAKSLAQKGMENIIRVEKTWEEVDLGRDLDPPYDLVLASMSLGMADIRGAVEKMNRVCRGRVVLFWHAGIPAWEIMPKALWPKLFNTQYHGGPKSDVLFQVLYQAGIYPEVQTFSSRFTEVFHDMEAAKNFYFKRFSCLMPEHGPELESFLQAHCEATTEGLSHGFDHTVMRFEWRVKEGEYEAV
ncbi:MAG: class I SAM-dependent methyltransferase [Desulfobacter sp.]|nr:MAG: class I SAM-dependent methyltransferase [Desulfobacter sp.]